MRIDHVAIWTKHLEELKDFYVEFFNGTCGEKYINSKKGFESYFIAFDDGSRLELMRTSTIPLNENSIGEQYIGIIHMAFAVESKLKVDELTETLRVKGYTIFSEPRVTGDGYYESCILDLDGNRIEITT